MKVLLLVHHKLVPPPGPCPQTRVRRAVWRTEYDVREALIRLGHQVQVVGLDSALQPLMDAVQGDRPDIVFNLLEEFAGEAVFDQNVANYLELIKMPYTGCNARGMALARDKATAKKIVAYDGIPTPQFFVISRHQRIVQSVQGLNYPVIIKYLTEEASLGISSKSVVKRDLEFQTQVKRMLGNFEADLLVEEYIAGREFYVGVWGHEEAQALPPRELHFGLLTKPETRIASSSVKWNPKYRRRHRVFTRTLRAGSGLEADLKEMALKVYRALRLSGYARIDFREDGRGKIYFIEANPNPQICQAEDFVDAAKAEGLDYDQIIQRILDLGLRPHFHPVAEV